MIFDAHIHQHYAYPDNPEEFLLLAHSAGISGGNIFSEAPSPSIGSGKGDYRWQARLEKILSFTEKTPGFHPFLWIDPTEPDIRQQIQTAVEQGIAGFKIICETFYPCDAIPACEMIAEADKPVMFHSGILGGSRDRICGKYNKPIEFECLFSIRNLRFSMAHLGWPWMEDYMGMVAKAAFTYDPDFGNRMYFDMTPGTPGINREDSLRKLYLTGYNVKSYVLWGTDGITGNYQKTLPDFWKKTDQAIMARIEKDADLALLPFQTKTPDLSGIWERATAENWKSFLKISES